MTMPNDIQIADDIPLCLGELSLGEYTDIASLAHACLILTNQTVTLQNAGRMIEIYRSANISGADRTKRRTQ